MSSQLYLKIDSVNRTNYATTNAGQFSIPLQQTISGKWSLKQAFVPVSNYNVSPTCNRIPFFENGTAKVAVLTPGYYTSVNDLMKEVALQMTSTSAGFATYTVTQSALPLRITISSTQAFSLQFGTDTVNSAAPILGYLPVNTAPATSQLATNISNLALIRSFNIAINNLTGFQDTKGASCSFIVPILGNTGSLTIYEPPQWYSQTIEFSHPLNVLNIKVSDDNNNALDLSADWYLILAQQ